MSIYLVGIIGLFRKLCFREVIFDEILTVEAYSALGKSSDAAMKTYPSCSLRKCTALISEC